MSATGRDLLSVIAGMQCGMLVGHRFRVEFTPDQLAYAREVAGVCRALMDPIGMAPTRMRPIIRELVRITGSRYFLRIGVLNSHSSEHEAKYLARRIVGRPDCHAATSISAFAGCSGWTG